MTDTVKSRARVFLDAHSLFNLNELNMYPEIIESYAAPPGQVPPTEASSLGGSKQDERCSLCADRVSSPEDYARHLMTYHFTVERERALAPNGLDFTEGELAAFIQAGCSYDLFAWTHRQVMAFDDLELLERVLLLYSEERIVLSFTIDTEPASADYAMSV